MTTSERSTSSGRINGKTKGAVLIMTVIYNSYCGNVSQRSTCGSHCKAKKNEHFRCGCGHNSEDMMKCFVGPPTYTYAS